MKATGLSPREDAIAKALECYMSEISEDFYCAGWLVDLEFDLWAIVTGDRSDEFGMGTLGDKRSVLRELADACGGWIVHEDGGCAWIVRAEWERRYESWRKR